MSMYNENEEFTPPMTPPETPPDLFPLEDSPPPAPPVVEAVAPVELEEEKLKPSDRSTMSQSTMIFGLIALSLSMLGGAFFILDIFQNGLSNNLVTGLVKAIPVMLAYAVGWILCMVSMRSFSNLVLPLFIKYYSWIALAGLVILYLKIMQKLFEQTYDLAHFFSYNIILAAGLAGMLGLHFLLDERDLRRYSIPIIMVSTWHLILMVVRFVVIEQNNPIYLFGDLYFFIIMFGLASLMLTHFGILNPIRNLIDAFFQRSKNKEIVA